MTTVILAAVLSLAILAGVARLLSAGPLPARVDAVALTVAAVAPALIVWQWPAEAGAIWAIACCGLWFLWRLVAPRKAELPTPASGSGRGAAAYRLLFAGAALWISFSLAGTHALGPSGQLGSIMLHMFAAVALVFAAAAWLLGTFAVPKDAVGGKIRATVGSHEALAAAAVALCFFAVV